MTHCSEWGGIPQHKLTDFGRQCIGILVRAYRMGPWNLPINWKAMEHCGADWCSFTVNCQNNSLATFDNDRLTRLVLEAHAENVRVSIAPRSYNYLEIGFNRRPPRGAKRSHPTLDDVVAAYTKETSNDRDQ